MKRLIGLLCLFGAANAAAAAITLVDDAGRTLQLPSPAQRVVTLAPNLTELVDAVGASSTLVGTLAGIGEASASVSVGDAMRLDVERIVSLRPDLVLVWRHGNNGRELEQLEAAGLPLFRLEPKRLEDVPGAIERVGRLLGREAAAGPRAQRLRAELAQLRARYAKAEPVTVFYQVWSRPLMTINREHLVSEVISLCGGRNVFADLVQLVPQLSDEAVLDADPQAMFAAREQSDGDLRWLRAPADPAFAGWLRYKGLTAVRQRWMFMLPGDAISRQGPNIAVGARAVCEALDLVRAERSAAGRRR
jgi:iron complex transport system substrate-binding protein